MRPCSKLYDTRFRDLAAPLTVASPDVYIDVQNAASMLFRLQRLGVEVGNRWKNWRTRPRRGSAIANCLHAAALADGADGHRPNRRASARLEAMRAFAKGRGTVPPIVRDYVLPIGRLNPRSAAGRHAGGRRADASGDRRHVPIRRQPRAAGRAEQLLVDAALKAGSTADIRLALERVAGRRAISPERYVGWREAANRAAVGAS